MKYPYDIVSYVRNKTFSIEARFARNKGEDCDRPLQVHNSTFSRFVFTAIANKRAATCNVAVDMLPEISARTQYAYQKHMEHKYATSSTAGASENNSPAFTTRFFAGALKGKSPVDVLLENRAEPEKGKKILNDQYKWLSENIQKFPKNKELMEAIKDASKVDLDSIDVSTANNIPPIELLNIGCRPLIRKKREDGKCFCYEASMLWDVNRDYPVSVRISNYYAPVDKKEDGTLNVKISAKDKSTEVVNEFNMLAGEWLNAVKEMERSEQAFYDMSIADAFKMAATADKENRSSAKGQATGDVA